MHLAKKAISSYVKSVHLNSNKAYFNIKDINLEELSLSYGLMMTPEMKVVKASQNDLKNTLHSQREDQGDGKNKMSKLQKLKHNIKMKKLQKTEQLNKMNEQSSKEEGVKIEDKIDVNVETESENEDREEEDFLKLKRKNVEDIDEIIEHVEDEYQFQNKDNMAKERKSGNFVEKVASKIKRNEDASKIIQKQRIFDKHKYDRMRYKARDYEKHHIQEEESGSDNEVKISDEQFEDNKHTKTQVNNESIEDKSNLALKLIREKGMLK